MSIITIAIKIKVIALFTVEGLSLLPLDFNLFSIRDPYNWPPSKDRKRVEYANIEVNKP